MAKSYLKSELRRIEGSLGGGGGNSPSEQSDSSFSTSIAQVLEILGEGRIEGFLPDTNDPAKSIYLDDTPIKNSNGTFNFQGVKVRTRRGVQYQDEIPNLETQEAEKSVNVEVKNNLPLTRNIINAELDAIRVRLGIQLQEVQDDGDVVGSELQFRISTKEGSDPWKVRKTQTIKGKHSQLREFEYEFNLNNKNTTVNQFQVRVEKLTSDSNSSRKIQLLRVQAITEIIRAKLCFPFTALANLEFDAKRFQSVPTRSFRVGGLVHRIPSNATVNPDRSLSFSGTWNGTFTNPGVAVNDPIWQLFEILTNKRWGLGNLIDERRIDKWSLYEISKHNNQKINDFLGGTEARYQCSTVINNKEKIYNVINALCSTCNVKPYWSNGTLYFWQDRPGNIIQQFTQADVADGDFVYSTTALRSRFTVANVTWNDPQDLYKQTYETVEDKDGIVRRGIRETDITAYGCVSRGQAIRYGRWALYTGKFNNETVSFTARAYATYLRPGDLIQIADRRRANVRYGGLIRGSNASSLELDTALPIYLDGSTISVMLDTGVIETRNIVAFANESRFVYPTVPFSSNPSPESNWIVSAPYVKPQIFRVLSVKPKSGDQTKVDITAIKHNPGIYDLIENNIPFVPIPIKLSVPPVVSLPINLEASLTKVANNFCLQCRWDKPLLNGVPDPFIKRYEVEYKRGLYGEWRDTKQVDFNEILYDNVIDGNYYFRVAAINVNGKYSNWVESSLSMRVIELHPDTRSYINRLATIDVTLTSAEITAINNFVNAVYSNNLRTSLLNDYTNRYQLISDCCLFAGNKFNGVKLWKPGLGNNFGNLNQPGTDQIDVKEPLVIFNNLNENHWSKARGIDPGDVLNSSSIDTQYNPRFHLANNPNGFHVGYFSTKNVSGTWLDIFSDVTEDTVNGDGLRVHIRFVDNNSFLDGYSVANTRLLGQNLNSKGYHLSNKMNANSLRIWMNGNLIASRDNAVTNTLVPNTNLMLLNGGTRSIGMYHAGFALTDAQSTLLNTLIQTLMTNLGRV